MESLEKQLVLGWKEQKKEDAEIFQAYEDIIQDGLIFLDLKKIENELTRYNLFNNVNSKKEVQKQIKEKIELITQREIKEVEKNPSIKLVKIADRMYQDSGTIQFCSCFSSKPLRVKRIKMEKIMKREEKLVKETQYRQLFIYCKGCGEIYWSAREIPKLL